MRDPNYIIEHFPVSKLSYYEGIFNSEKFTAQDKLTAAMEILNIDEFKFNHIPFKVDKRALLDYKYNLTHFELNLSKYEHNYRRHLEKFKELAKRSAHFILQHSVMTEHHDKYSKFAQGLSSLHQRTGHYAAVTDSPFELDASVISVGAKTGGIEPGFMAAHHQDIITWLVNHFDGDEESLIEFINVNNGNLDQVFELIKDNLPKYLYKLDYKTDNLTRPKTPGATQVFLTEEDVKRTSNVKNSYKYSTFIGNMVAGFYVRAKQSTALEINKEAIIETLSNDFASFFMRVQQQKLFITSHTNGALKFMPQAMWVNGSEQFGSDERMLAGSDNDTHNYRGKTLIMGKEGITSLTDTSIMNPSRLLIPLLFTGDYDKIGSKGQNMLILATPQDEAMSKKYWELVGIDFGHTLRENNPLIINQLIHSDARFNQPNHLFSKPFKNFSALTDGCLSDKMQGALILARLRGVIIDDNIIASYGNEFYQFYNNIPSGEGSTLCNNYISAIKTFQEQDYNNGDEYAQYIATIQQFKERMNGDMDKLLSIFKGYLYYPAKAIDLADNLNKRCAATLGKTTLRSQNGRHGLNHIGIQQDYFKTWNIELIDNHYTFSCAFSHDQLSAVEAALKQKNSPNILVKKIDGRLSVKFHKIHLDEISELFNENDIKIEFHKRDFEAINAGYTEIRLHDFIKSPWFRKNNLEMDLSLNPRNKNQYRLILYATEGKSLSNELENIITNLFNKSLVKNALVLDFEASQLSEMIENLEMIQKTFELHLELPYLPAKVQETDVTSPNLSTIVQEVEIPSSSPDLMREVKIHTPNRLCIEIPLTYFNDSVQELKEELNTAITFKKVLSKLVTCYENSGTIESNSNTSTPSMIYGMFYNLGRNAVNSVWATPNSSVLLMPSLKKYIEANHADNIEEIIGLLKSRKEYVSASLLNTAPGKYSLEMQVLESAISCGSQLINNQERYSLSNM